MYRVVIPARHASTRLPGKPLIELAGKPMLQWVHESARRSQASTIVVATDDERIASTARAFGADVQMTACTVWPHAMRVYNFMAVSDSPFEWDRERWRHTLETFAIDGVPAIDRTTKAGQDFIADLMGYPDTILSPSDEGLESRESILKRTKQAGAGLVTDDNMLPEFRHVLRFQEPP